MLIKVTKEYYWRALERYSIYRYRAKLLLVRYAHLPHTSLETIAILVRLWAKATWWALTGRRRTVVAIALVEHMGDIVAGEPIARFLRNRTPNAHIVWVVRKAYQALPRCYLSVDEVLPVTCLTTWVWLRRSRVIDQVHDLHLSNRFCPICKIKLVKQDGNLTISAENYYSHGNLLRVMCENGALPPMNEQPRLSLPSAVSKRVDQFLLPLRYIVFHCKSIETTRDWTIDGWHALFARVRDELRVPVVEIGQDPVVASYIEDSYVSLCGRLSILESAEVIRRATTFVGIDSGPAHLANAVGTRGVVLLGAYRSFLRYVPYSGDYASQRRSTLIYAQGPASSLGVEEVFAAVRDAFIRETRVTRQEPGSLAAFEA